MINDSTIHVTAPSILKKTLSPPQTMPQRSPFAIQELLGLTNSNTSPSTESQQSVQRSLAAATSLAAVHGLYENSPGRHFPPGFVSDPANFNHHHHHHHHHQMSMAAASRMAYLNAQAAVAAAFLPHNIAAAMSSSGQTMNTNSVLNLTAGQHPSSHGKSYFIYEKRWILKSGPNSIKIRPYQTMLQT